MACQPRYSWPLPALIHWEVKAGSRSMKDVGGAVLAGSTPPFRGEVLMMMFITIIGVMFITIVVWVAT